MTDNKFPEELRTFETRLLFIRDLFQNRYPQFEIMAKCIEHKLGRSYEAYLREVNKSYNKLIDEKPINVLRHIRFKQGE